MSFTCGDCFTGIQGLLMGRTVSSIVMCEAMRKAVLELTEDYKHPLLEDTGPVVNFIAYQNNYAPSYFLNAPDAALDVSKVNSFFIYNNPFVAPSQVNNLTNS